MTLIDALSPSNWINMIVPSSEVCGSHILVQNEVVELEIKVRSSQ